MANTTHESRPSSIADEERLQQLLDRWEAMREAGHEISVEQLCVDDPDLSPMVQEQIDALLEVGSFVDGWEAVEPAARPERIGRYRVVGELGRGGSAVVYLCQQNYPRRQVALKILQPARAAGKLGERFRREIQFLATLNHPGIAQIYDAGIADLGQGPQPYFTMEWIQGQQLDEFIRSRKSQHRSPGEAVQLLLKVCEAVEFAHDHGIIHRDLKPANILVTEARQPKVLDFGIARIKRRDGKAHDLTTMTQNMLGTPPYMSPEQFTEDSRAVDARTDVYSLGVILYELLTGCLPYDVQNTSVVETGRIICETPPRLAGRIDRRLRGNMETILSKALDKDPDDRYQSVSALAADMRRYLAGEPIAAQPIGPREQLWRWCRRNPRSALLGAATLATLVVACVVSIYFGNLAKQRAADLGVSLIGLRRERERADSQAGLARQRSRDLAAAKSQLEYQVEELRRSVFNCTLMRVSSHTASDPQMAASMLLDEHLCPKDLRGFAWNALYRQTERELGRIQAHDREVIALDLSADGSTLASAGLDGKLRVWRWDSLESIACFDVEVGVNTRIALSGDGSRVLVITPQGRVLLATVAEQDLVDQPTVRLEKAACVAISPQGRWLAVGDQAGGVRVWETHLDGRSLGEPSLEFTMGAVSVRALRFDSGGRRLGGVARDGVVCEWDLDSAMLVNRDQLPMNSLRYAAISAMFRRVVATQRYEKILVGGHPMGNSRKKIAHWRSPLSALRVLASASERIGPTTERNYVYAWEGNVRKSTLSVGTVGSVRSLAFSPHGDAVAVGFCDGTIASFRIIPPPGIHAGMGGRDEVISARFSPDGKLLASSGPDGRVAIHDVQSVPRVVHLLEHQVPAMDILFTPDGRYLISADENNVLRLWDVRSGQITDTFSPPGERLSALALSRDGARLFGVGASGSLLVYSMLDRQLIARKAGHPVRCSALALSPDGRTLASGDETGYVLLWDAISLEVRAGFQPHDQRIGSLVFSPDGSILATGARDHTINLWEVKPTGLTLTKTLRFHAAQVTSLDFSPDGSLLASSDRDLRVILWDTATWQPRAVLGDEITWIRCVRFSPHGRLLAMAGSRDTVRLWDGSPAAIRTTNP